MYTNCEPYFDFCEDEGSWCVVYPSKRGINATVGWERTGEGTNDYRYLAMCDRLIKKAKARNLAAKEAAAAEAFLAETLKGIDVEKSHTADLTPEKWDEFKSTLAGHIAALVKAVGE
jgi:hypothetical protein